jgi:hypothetical protein
LIQSIFFRVLEKYRGFLKYFGFRVPLSVWVQQILCFEYYGIAEAVQAIRFRLKPQPLRLFSSRVKCTGGSSTYVGGSVRSINFKS